jgi:AcrR family transcriptional regulator
MGIAERKNRQKEEVRSMILETAWKQIREEGVSSLSIRKIADAIEYSIPVIYNHFDSKDAILRVFVQTGYSLLAEEMGQAKATRKVATQQLEVMAEAYWNFACANTEYYQLMFGLGIPSCEAVRQVSEIQVFGELIQSSIKRVIATSNHPEADVHLKFHTYWSILHGIISIRMNDTTSHSKEMSLSILKDAIAGFIYLLGR